MTSLLDLWCECDTASTEGGITHRPLPVAMFELTGEQLLHCLEASTAEWVGFGPAALSVAGLEQSLRTSTANVVLAACYPTSHFRHIWETYPPAVASLVFPPDAVGGLLFRRELLGKTGVHPVCLWDALIQLIRAGETVDMIEVTRAAGGSATWPFLPRLEPEHRPRDWFSEHVESLDEATLAAKVRSSADFTAFKAGLLQLHDYLDASHSQSQSVEGTQNADYWHGIMHRREEDYDNAKYWFRRVGPHPVFDLLTVRAAEIIDDFDDPTALFWTAGISTTPERRARLLPGGRWDACAFVDICRKNRGYDPELNRVAQCVQLEEMLLLLEHIWKAATGT